jgi:hypothetical protein
MKTIGKEPFEQGWKMSCNPDVILGPATSAYGAGQTGGKAVDIDTLIFLLSSFLMF